ncbi:MAG: amino acid permease, partial [Actinomycetota bacterium]
AVPRALAAVLVVYVVVGVTLLAVVPAGLIAATDAPLRLVAEVAGSDALAGLVRIGAGIAALGVLLNLIPGVSRTSLAMARNHELPHALAHVDTTRSLPIRAELTVTVVVILLVVVVDLRDAIALSGVAVLTYYAVTNVAALTLTPDQRRWPRWIAWLGLVGCIVLVGALPPAVVASGVGVLAVGVVVRAVAQR